MEDKANDKSEKQDVPEATTISATTAAQESITDSDDGLGIEVSKPIIFSTVLKALQPVLVLYSIMHLPLSLLIQDPTSSFTLYAIICCSFVKDKKFYKIIKVKVQDLSLPRAVVTRVSKSVLPANAQIQKEAVLAISKSATAFVNYISSQYVFLKHLLN